MPSTLIFSQSAAFKAFSGGWKDTNIKKAKQQTTNNS